MPRCATNTVGYLGKDLGGISGRSMATPPPMLPHLGKTKPVGLVLFRFALQKTTTRAPECYSTCPGDHSDSIIARTTQGL